MKNNFDLNFKKFKYRYKMIISIVDLQGKKINLNILNCNDLIFKIEQEKNIKFNYIDLYSDTQHLTKSRFCLENELRNNMDLTIIYSDKPIRIMDDDIIAYTGVDVNLNHYGGVVYRNFDTLTKRFGYIKNWNVSFITDMANWFRYPSELYWLLDENGELRENDIEEIDLDGIENWDVSSVKNFCGTFKYNKYFNKDISLWDVGRAETMFEMFCYCELFNQPIDLWDVSNVITMNCMFYKCVKFNKNINAWDVSNVISMSSMFHYCLNFNQPLCYWNVSKVYTMDSMFSCCLLFNQSLISWDFSNVKIASLMFSDCVSFNQSLEYWNINVNEIKLNGTLSNCYNYNFKNELYNKFPKKICDLIFLNTPPTE